MKPAILGGDVSKLTVDVCLLIGKRAVSNVFANDPAGFEALMEWLAQCGDCRIHACLEATGSYGDSLAFYLVERVWRVSVINPRLIKHHAIASGVRTKTDRVDARVIADYCRAHDPRAWEPFAPNIIALRGLVRRRSDLVGQRTQEKSRRRAPGTTAEVLASIEEHIAFLDASIAKLEARIEETIASDAELARTQELMLSIPGVGRVTASILIAEIGDFGRFKSARQLAAFLGLVPRHRQSGTSVRGRPRLSKAGNAFVRQALHHPALSAIRFCPHLREFYARKVAEGRNGALVVGAVMRKLVHTIFGVVRSGQPYSEELARGRPVREEPEHHETEPGTPSRPDSSSRAWARGEGV